MEGWSAEWGAVGCDGGGRASISPQLARWHTFAGRGECSMAVTPTPQHTLSLTAPPCPTLAPPAQRSAAQRSMAQHTRLVILFQVAVGHLRGLEPDEVLAVPLLNLVVLRVSHLSLGALHLRTRA